jgi:isopentenyl diphosphate isomerase/L-lactate dehydrogenase-like FMN-dependent dehydrogenase
MERAMTIDDYEPLARERLPKEVFDFVAGGAGDEWTLRENTRAFDRWVIRPRVLRGVEEPDTATEVLGVPLAMPVAIAPWAYQRLVHPEGELATARAAANAGTLMVVATPAERDLEAIAAVSDAPKWFQLYVLRDRRVSEGMLHRAAEAGYGAVVFTVDLPVGGLRHRDLRNAFEIPPSMRARGGEYERGIRWDDVAWIKEHTGLPVLVKGILAPGDVPLALEAGADGVIVSNHGGRQLDGTPASVDALPGIVASAGGRIPVLMDGGVRRGTDVLKAIALGATMVFVGKAAAWGLAVDGEDGVARVLEILREELENAMILSGCHSVSEITPELVTRASPTD